MSPKIGPVSLENSKTHLWLTHCLQVRGQGHCLLSAHVPEPRETRVDVRTKFISWIECLQITYYVYFGFNVVFRNSQLTLDLSSQFWNIWQRDVIMGIFNQMSSAQKISNVRWSSQSFCIRRCRQQIRGVHVWSWEWQLFSIWWAVARPGLQVILFRPDPRLSIGDIDFHVPCISYRSHSQSDPTSWCCRLPSLGFSKGLYWKSVVYILSWRTPSGDFVVSLTPVARKVEHLP